METPARPGQRITLAVDITLPPRVHVYAPGVTGYVPLRWNIPQFGAFRLDPAVYPKPKRLRLAAIHETSLVYERSIRLTQTVTLAHAPELEPLLDSSRDLSIPGELRYQACDDRECFVPETVPLKWKVHVLPFDRTRVAEPLRRRP